MTDTTTSALGLKPEPAEDKGAYRRGVLLVLLVAFLWSFSGLLIRGIESAGTWQIIFYRSLGVVIGTGLIVLWRHRGAAPRAFAAVGLDGAAAAFCLAAASVCYFQALQVTTVANISFVLAAHPFFAALLAWLLMRERVSAATLAAAALAVGGVAIMVLDGLSGSGFLGILLAIGTSVAAAGYAVALRRGRRVDMTPAVTLSGMMALVATAPLVGGDFAISWHDLGICLMQGMVISAFCNCLFAFAARAVPAAELTFFTLLETVLSPIWVWLVIAEMPSRPTLIGGAVILVAVMGHALVSTRRPRRAAMP